MNYEAIRSLRTVCIVPLTTLCLVSAAAQAQTSSSAAPSAGMPYGQMQKGADGSHDMRQTMMKGMEGMQKMQMSGDIDKDFAMMMKMHHQQALEMAQMELAHGKSPAMKAMAKNIISEQKKEIAQFDKWLATQK